MLLHPLPSGAYRALGGRGLSDFHERACARKVAEHASGLVLLSVSELFLLELSTALTVTDEQRLAALLALSATSDEPPGVGVLVLPRLGIHSPWSSRAIEILHRVGLHAVNCLVRGLLYSFDAEAPDSLLPLLHDALTESVLRSAVEVGELSSTGTAEPMLRVPVLERGLDALEQINRHRGLALSPTELRYLEASYRALGRDPGDLELMMFAQANSEHCRHKVFNARWRIDGDLAPHSLFEMICNTSKRSPDGLLSAYSDNAAVIVGNEVRELFIDAESHRYRELQTHAHIVAKVETHNHPTAISPFPGAATGAGGEIRDEGATGRGARPKAGLCGFTLSDLHLPGAVRPWEQVHPRPARIATPLQIITEGPLGAARFNNEFGRPNLGGYFRTFEHRDGACHWGYHKPVMIAGGIGSIRPEHLHKAALQPGVQLVVLGGPAMRIGLGGGATSSTASGRHSELLDYASVQRDNAEVQRRCQEVLDRCNAMGSDSPVLFIHDVGAGGLSNALPELMKDSGLGGCVRLSDIPSAEPDMTPLELWCNEAQERYVLAVQGEDMARFASLCERENCLFAVVGEGLAEPVLRLLNGRTGDRPTDVPLSLLFDHTPRLERTFDRREQQQVFDFTEPLDLLQSAQRVLWLPAVGSKSFLVTIGDRSVGGLVARDQMVGRWQLPLADVAVTSADFCGYRGEAMAMGERTPLAVYDSAAAARMAVAEVVTNMLAARIDALGDIRLSANWMAAVHAEGQDQALYDAVAAIGLELCPELGMAIPVGKDSLSMQTRWRDADTGTEHEVVSPVSLIATGFAPVLDVRDTVTPELRLDCGETSLLLVDLGCGRNRLGGSALAQVWGCNGGAVPDLDEPELLRALFELVQWLHRESLLLACHDRSDGGLWAALAEMAFASRAGLAIELGALGTEAEALAVLFAEEIGVVLQVPTAGLARVREQAGYLGLGELLHEVARPTDLDRLAVTCGGHELFSLDLTDALGAWWDTSYRIQQLRDNPETAEQERTAVLGAAPGLRAEPAFSLRRPLPAVGGARPQVAILREQGVNGHREMAAAFIRAGFDAVDVHMRDLLAGSGLEAFQMLAACGGFSYGDVLGGGVGWARSVLFHEAVRDTFTAFFDRPDTLTLGVCNGCQMLAQLADIIPGAEGFPMFRENYSGRFEARLVQVAVPESPSLLFADMAGSLLPVVVAHGEGRADLVGTGAEVPVCLRYAESRAEPAQHYPANPNGSPQGIAGVSSRDGRVTLLMPHPERMFRRIQWSWSPPEWRTGEWAEDSPWLQLFFNARAGL